MPVPNDLLEEMENEWAPPSHPVFRLVPNDFELQVQNLYTMLGAPPVSHSSFLEVFRQLRDAFQPYEPEYPLATYIHSHDRDHDREQESVAILLGLKKLRPGEEMGVPLVLEDEDDCIPPATVRPGVHASSSRPSPGPEHATSRSRDDNSTLYVDLTI